jgi:hypothetical protein
MSSTVLVNSVGLYSHRIAVADRVAGPINSEVNDRGAPRI